MGSDAGDTKPIAGGEQKFGQIERGKRSGKIAEADLPADCRGGVMKFEAIWGVFASWATPS